MYTPTGKRQYVIDIDDRAGTSHAVPNERSPRDNHRKSLTPMIHRPPRLRSFSCASRAAFPSGALRAGLGRGPYLCCQYVVCLLVVTALLLKDYIAYYRTTTIHIYMCIYIYIYTCVSCVCVYIYI